MVSAIIGPILLFTIMYTAFALWRLRAQGRLPSMKQLRARWLGKPHTN